MNVTCPPPSRCHRRWRPVLQGVLAVMVVLGLMVAALAPTPSLAQATVPTPNAVLSLAVAPRSPDRVLAGVLNSPQPAAVWRTQDGGLTWQNTTPGLSPNISIAAITFDPRNSRMAFAADGGSGFLYRSNDGGTSWVEVPSVRDYVSSNSAIGELYATNEGAGLVLYAGTRFDGVLRTADAGNTWQRLDAGLVGEARRIRELLEYGGNLYAGTHDGLYRLPTGGTTWTRVDSFPDGGIVYSLATQGNTLYAGTDTALYRSDDGDTWTRVPNTPSTIYYDVVDTGRLLVLGTENGLFAGSGESWAPANVDGVPYTAPIYALANTPRAPHDLRGHGRQLGAAQRRRRAELCLAGCDGAAGRARGTGDGYADRHTYGHANQHGHADQHAHGNCHGDADGDPDQHPYTDQYAGAYCHAYTAADRYAQQYADRHLYGCANRDCRKYTVPRRRQRQR